MDRTEQLTLNTLEIGDWFGFKATGIQLKVYKLERDTEGNVVRIGHKGDFGGIKWHEAEICYVPANA